MESRARCKSVNDQRSSCGRWAAGCGTGYLVVPAMAKYLPVTAAEPARRKRGRQRKNRDVGGWGIGRDSLEMQINF